MNTEGRDADLHKRMFAVEISGEIYVLAEDWSEAEHLAKRALQTGDADELIVDSSPIEPGSFVDPEWLDAIPYGSESGVTVKEWYEKTPLLDEQRIDHPSQTKFPFEEKGPTP